MGLRQRRRLNPAFAIWRIGTAVPVGNKQYRLAVSPYWMQDRKTVPTCRSGSPLRSDKTASEDPPPGGDEVPIAKHIGNRMTVPTYRSGSPLRSDKTGSEDPPPGGDEVPIAKRIGNRMTAGPQDRKRGSATRRRRSPDSKAHREPHDPLVCHGQTDILSAFLLRHAL